jgi:ribosomal-protein-alanine N-acetyltransferase
MNLKKNIQTNRLILRPFKLSDAGGVQKLAGDFEIADTTLFIPHPYEDGIAELWIRSHAEKFAKGKELIYAITEKKSEELVGSIGLTINPDHDHAELGYWIGKSYWNRGYATEAAKAMLGFGFGELNLERIHAHCLTRNKASGKVLLKLGMQHEGRLRKHIKKWNKLEDIEMYGILRTEYRSGYARTNLNSIS